MVLTYTTYKALFSLISFSTHNTFEVDPIIMPILRLEHWSRKTQEFGQGHISVNWWNQGHPTLAHCSVVLSLLPIDQHSSKHRINMPKCLLNYVYEIYALWSNVVGLYNGPGKDLHHWEDPYRSEKNRCWYKCFAQHFESFANKFSRILAISVPEALEVSSSALSPAQAANSKYNGSAYRMLSVASARRAVGIGCVWQIQ